MATKQEIALLDKYYPPCGKCAFCGHKDKRHRLWDAIMALDESDEDIAHWHDQPIEHVKMVRKIRPYRRKK